MTAAVQVFGVQIRKLGYPLLAIFALVCIPIIDPSSYFKEAYGFLLVVLSLILAGITGANIFGFEYNEGARDYLATRPYPVWKHYQFKISALVLFTVVISVLAAISFSLMDDLDALAIVLPIYWVALISIALWCALVTVMTQDTVRGVLYGSLTLVPLSFLVGWFWGNVLIPWLMGVSDVDVVVVWDYNSHLIGCSPYFLLPFLLNAVLSTTYRASYAKKVFFPWHLITIGTLVFLYTGFALKVIANDGSLEFSAPPQTGDGGGAYLGFGIEDEKLRYVHSDPSRVGYGLYELEYNRADSTPLLLSMLSSVDLPLPRDIIPAAFFEGDKLYLMGGGVTRCWTVAESGTATLIPEEGGDHGIGSYAGKYFSQSSRGRELEIGNKVYTLKQDPGDPYGFVSVREAGGSDSHLGPTPFLGKIAVDENFIAGFCSISSPLGVFHSEIPWAHQNITLIDVRDLNHPRMFYLELDKYLYLPTQLIQAVRGSSLTETQGIPNLSLGGGYLFAWFQNSGHGAAWDVRDPANPRYLGRFPIPIYSAPPIDDYNIVWKSHNIMGPPPTMMGPTTPMIRDDGALGFVSPHYGPFWIQFPELAKEARS